MATNRHRIELALNGPSIIGSIKLDDIEIGSAVTSIEIPHTAVGEVLMLNLGMALLEGMRFKGSPYIGVSPESAEVLVRLGWTPPEGAENGE